MKYSTEVSNTWNLRTNHSSEIMSSLSNDKQLKLGTYKLNLLRKTILYNMACNPHTETKYICL